MQQPLIGQGFKLQMLWIWNKAAGRQTFSLKPLQSSSHFTSRTICMSGRWCGQNWLWRQAQFCVINLTCKWRNMNQSERVFVWGQSENDANWSDTTRQYRNPLFTAGTLFGLDWYVWIPFLGRNPLIFVRCVYIYIHRWLGYTMIHPIYLPKGSIYPSKGNLII